MTKQTYSPVLFDVDGTIVASGELVMECFQQTMQQLDLPLLPAATLRKVVGPPLAVSMNLLAGVPEEDVDEAVKVFRSFYLPRFLEPKVYPGVRELLADLHQAGVALATATTKREDLARQQLDHLELSQYFTVIAGATADPLCSKTAVVSDALKRLSAAGCPATNPVLIGDRSFDVEGAEMNGIKLIGAGWGYGERSEFESPAVLTVANTVEEVRPYLL